MPTIRPLTAADQPAFEAFLAPRVRSSIFLLANSRAAGFEDRGAPVEGTYFGAFSGPQLLGVCAHYWNGNLILQAVPELVPALVATAEAAAVRRVLGVIGPAAQVAAGVEALGRPAEDVQMDEPEGLYELDLAALKVPPALARGELTGRLVEARDLPVLTEWEVGYRVETLGFEASPEFVTQMRAVRERHIAEGQTWILEHAGRPVATTRFNSRLDEVVQIGGVWTPPALRGRGYGRAAVAASLLGARAEGVARSVLFTGVENRPAVKAYEALGYRRVGDYRVLLYKGYGAAAR